MCVSVVVLRVIWGRSAAQSGKVRTGLHYYVLATVEKWENE